MDIIFNGSTYKSISNINWQDVPMLSVITGPNGSGKTQLLELIYNTIVRPLNPQPPVAIINNATYNANEISFLRSQWVLQNSSPINLVSIQQEIGNLYNQFSQSYNTQNSPRLNFLFNGIAKKLGKPRGNTVSLAEFSQNIPIEFLKDDNDIINQISRIFLDYHISRIESTAGGLTNEEINGKIGPKPWVLLDEIMKESGLPFCFNNPESTSIKALYKLEITNTQRNCKVEFGDLSSGEKVLVSLVFFLYTSQEKAEFFPKFLLLDEPDAHLHPSMTKQFLDVIQNVFVKKHNIRVIITTHSPSTVALTPKECLFEMNRTEPRITKSVSKNKTISLLTAGLVIVGVGTKYFLVEDEDDATLYQEIYSHLTSDNRLIGDIPIVFIPSSTKTKTGGKSQVYSWVNKLSSSGLEDIIKGIIDRDAGNQPSQGIHILHRYSIENYLLDPINVYAALMDKDHHPRLPTMPLNLGDEYKLRELTALRLQEIADLIHAEIEPLVEKHFSDFDVSEKSRESIQLVTGQILNYPRWLINRRGKTLLNEIYHKRYADIHPGSLLKAFKKAHVLPMEMLEFYKELES